MIVTAFLIIALLAACIAIVLKKLHLAFTKYSNPFSVHLDIPGKPLELEKSVRKGVLKKAFHPKHVPNEIDAIIIGSGMGGLTCAGLLACVGKKVLVLEQHDRIGGCTHAYKSKGFEYDIGIHYIGNMEHGSMNRCMIDTLTDGNLKWLPLHDNFDTVVVKQKDKSLKKYPMMKGRKAMKEQLKKSFPNDKNAIDNYFKLLEKARSASSMYVLLKMLPFALLKVISILGLDKMIFKRYEYVTKASLQSVLDKLTDNEELKCVLGYSFGDYGSMPSSAPFLMHAMLINHFARSGGYYPYGGASEIAFQMVPAIEKAGGCVLARASVESILFEGEKACGVKLSDSSTHPGCELRAPCIISDAGVYNTYSKLLPPQIQKKHGAPVVKQTWIEPGYPCFQVMVGLNGESKDIGLEAKNYWLYTSARPEEDMQKYLSLSAEEAINTKVPLLFISFPSAKDPSWNLRFPGKSNCVIVTFSNNEWFEPWEDKRVKKRGEQYEAFKTAFVQQIWRQVLEVFPYLEDKVVDMHGGTPLSHKHYLNSPNGEIYGINHNKERFFTANAAKLRPVTKIPGLYLTGQDVFTAGFIGSAFGGVLAASTVLERNLFVDLISCVKKTRKLVKEN